jgi:hypothetical protein
MPWTHYNLNIPNRTYRQLKRIAQQEDTTIADLLRRSMQFFLFIHLIKGNPGARLFIERTGEIQEIVTDLI